MSALEAELAPQWADVDDELFGDAQPGSDRDFDFAPGDLELIKKLLQHTKERIRHEFAPPPTTITKIDLRGCDLLTFLVNRSMIVRFCVRSTMTGRREVAVKL